MVKEDWEHMKGKEERKMKGRELEIEKRVRQQV
jgi:hypothetical protein